MHLLQVWLHADLVCLLNRCVHLCKWCVSLGMIMSLHLPSVEASTWRSQMSEAGVLVRHVSKIRKNHCHLSLLFFKWNKLSGWQL